MKTVRFRAPGYVGDPINAVRIYNQKEVDELVFLDIAASLEERRPRLEVLAQIASECFMPVAYGGGIRQLEDIRDLFALGIEKVCVNTYAVENPQFVREAADEFGSQSIVASLDARSDCHGYRIYIRHGQRRTNREPAEFAAEMERMGAGEILVTSIDRDGTQEGYDLDLIRLVSNAVSIPVVASGGAGSIEDFGRAIAQGGASACAVGSMVVYYGRNRAVLISFPARQELERMFVLHGVRKV